MINELKKRCIMVFPKFKNMEVIDRIREQYDPLANHVAPHITLVFPFDSTLSKETVENHLQKALEGIKPFHLVLDELVPSTEVGNYLFFCPSKGKDKIEAMHEALYTGVLEAFKPEWLQDTKFMPHMTIGSFNDTKSLEEAYENLNDKTYLFETVVDTVSVEIIDENEDSMIEIEVNLAG